MTGVATRRLDERQFAPALRAIERARRLAPQLRMLARVHSGIGGAALAVALGLGVVLSSAALFVREVPSWALAFGGAFVAAFGVLGALWLALGLGLRRRARWSRTLGIACGALLLPFAPLGTVLGFWTLAVLLGWNPRLGRAAGSQ